MADTLYLSLWYPNLRLAALPDKLTAVLGAFAAHGGESRVYAATVWPVSWSEAPVFQRVWGRMAAGPMRGGAHPAERGVPPHEPGGVRGNPGADPRQAVEEALELLHDDYAYEFQIGWNLWELETGNAGLRSASNAGPHSTSAADATSAQDDTSELSAQDDVERVNLDPQWVREARLMRVSGFGPLFDEGAYEQEGHIKVDFGSDAPFLEEDADLDAVGARHVEQNVRQLVELTAAIEKESGATARLLWSELGESLAQRLAARLGMGN